MRPGQLLRTAATIARKQLVASFLTLVVVALMCLTALATVGRATATDAALRANLDAAGGRILAITDVKELGVINPATVAVTTGLSTVEAAIALGPARDFTNGALPGATAVPIRSVNTPAPAVTLTAGRWPQPGEAIVGPDAAHTLRLNAPTGYLVGKTGEQLPIVGLYSPKPGFETLSTLALTPVAADQWGLTELKVLAKSITTVKETQQQVLSFFGSVDPQGLSITSPSGLVTATDIINNELSSANKAMLSLILAVGALFIAIVTLADTLLHRKELGRRRALGARRADLALLYTLRTTLPAAIGATMSSAVTWAIFATRDTVIPVDFTVAITVLAVATAALASLPPATWAAHRDPVTVLRTP